jgi:hypothetical protein
VRAQGQARRYADRQYRIRRTGVRPAHVRTRARVYCRKKRPPLKPTMAHVMVASSTGGTTRRGIRSERDWFELGGKGGGLAG